MITIFQDGRHENEKAQQWMADRLPFLERLMKGSVRKTQSQLPRNEDILMGAISSKNDEYIFIQFTIKITTAGMIHWTIECVYVAENVDEYLDMMNMLKPSKIA